jgi:hypothetical protein
MELQETVAQYLKVALILNQLSLAALASKPETNGIPRAVESAKSFRQADFPSLFHRLPDTVEHRWDVARFDLVLCIRSLHFNMRYFSVCVSRLCLSPDRRSSPRY